MNICQGSLNRLSLCHTNFENVCITSKKTVSIPASCGQCFFLTAYFCYYFNSPIQDPVHCLKGLFRVHSGRFLSYLKKRKISQNNHSLSFVVTCCHLLSFVVIRCRSLSLIVICCHSLSLVVPLIVFRCHSLSFIVTRCNTYCHWLSLDVSLVCLFINDFLLQNNSGGCF